MISVNRNEIVPCNMLSILFCVCIFKSPDVFITQAFILISMQMSPFHVLFSKMPKLPRRSYFVWNDDFLITRAYSLEGNRNKTFFSSSSHSHYSSSCPLRLLILLISSYLFSPPCSSILQSFLSCFLNYFSSLLAFQFSLIPLLTLPPFSFFPSFYSCPPALPYFLSFLPSFHISCSLCLFLAYFYAPSFSASRGRPAQTVCFGSGK